MIQEAETGRRVPPAEMETCQEAISVAYALLQRHPGMFLGKRFDDLEEDDSEDEEDDQDALSVNPCRDDASPSEPEEINGEEEEKNQDALRAASSLIASLYRALQGSSLSREAAVSAGVTVAAAVGAGIASDPKRHAAALADAFVGCDDDDDSQTASDAASAESSKVSSEKNFNASSSSWCRANGVDPAPTESLALATLYQKTPTTFARLSDAMHPFGRLCAARGVLTAASAEALAFPLEVPKRARRFFVGESGRRFAAPGEKTQADGKPSWTLLTSYLLPYICASLERPEDSHHKYHAAAALRAALVRVKALAASGVRRRERSGLDDGWFFSLDEAFPAPLRDRVCAILWANWEDPLSQTVKETHLSFETLLDIEEARGGMTGNGENKNENAFLEDAARSLLKKDASRKGRYVPLAAVARRLGAKRLLSLAPDLLAKTLSAMKDDSVCTAAGALVAAVSQSLLFETTTEEEDADARINETALPGAEKSRAEKKKPRRTGKDETTVAAAGSPAALASWRAWWVGPMTDALLSAGKQRAGVGTYALPAFLKQDGASVVCLLARIQESASCASSAEGTSDPSDAKEKTSFTHRDTNSVASAVVAVLRSARALGLLDPEDPSRVSSRVAKAAARTFAWRETSFTKTSTDDGKVLDDDISYGVAPDVLLAAATRRDARSRRDALDLLCVDGKRFSLPGALERAVLRAAIPTHLRDADAAFRGALVSSLTHLMSRIKAGCLKAAAFARARPELFTERGNTEDANANANAKEKKKNARARKRERRASVRRARHGCARDGGRRSQTTRGKRVGVRFFHRVAHTNARAIGVPRGAVRAETNRAGSASRRRRDVSPGDVFVWKKKRKRVRRGTRRVLGSRARGVATGGFSLRDALPRPGRRDVPSRRRRGQLGQTARVRVQTALQAPGASGGHRRRRRRRRALRVGSGALAVAPRARERRGGAAAAPAVPQVRAGRGLDHRAHPGDGRDAAGGGRGGRRRAKKTPFVSAEANGETSRCVSREKKYLRKRFSGFFSVAVPRVSRGRRTRANRPTDRKEKESASRPLMLANIFSNMC